MARKKLTREEALDRLKTRGMEIHGDLYDYGHFDYVDRMTPSWIICKRCGMAFLQSINKHISKARGCEACNKKENSKKRLKPNDVFKAEVDRLFNGFYDLSHVDYKGAKVPVTVICPRHGKFKIRPNDLLNGHGCALCQQSRMEREVEALLRDNGIAYEPQVSSDRFSWLGRLRLDFYLTDYNIAIECQGVQHFRPVEHFGGEEEFLKVIERDRRKLSLCEENGVRLVYFSNEMAGDYIGPVINGKEGLITFINGTGDS